MVISSKQSHKVWTMLISAPYLTVIGHVLIVHVIGLVMEIGGRNTKTPGLIAGAPFPFPFRAFLPLAIPFFGPATQDTLTSYENALYPVA